MPARPALFPPLIVTLVLLFAPATAKGDEQSESAPLHRRIDAAIEAAHVGPMSIIAPEAEFLRRCFLDLIGRIPSVDETRTFLADTSADKRPVLIDQLLANDRFNHHFAVVFDIMLMERRTDNRIGRDQWRAYLVESLASKKPYDQLAREILASDGADLRPAAKFYLERTVETHALTRDVSRMFFGRDVQCAQCHDHPLIDEYSQSEYFGLVAFLNRSHLFEDSKDNKKAYVAEKADGSVEFSSVFEPDSGKSRAFPYLIDGLALDSEPHFDGEEAYRVKPAKDQRAIPKFSRREQLARLATHPSNRAFARNAVNRLWAHMMGHGIVDPVDLHHDDNPPSHPQLLQLLADEFVAMNYDIRELLRQIALSNAYQRSIDLPADAPTPDSAKRRIEMLDAQIKKQELTCDQLRQSAGTFRATLTKERDKVAALTTRLTKQQERLNKARQTRDETAKKKDEAQKQLAAKEGLLTSAKNAVAAAKNLVDALAKDKPVADALATLTGRAETIGKEVEAKKAVVKQHDEALQAASKQVEDAKQELIRLEYERMALADLAAEARGAYRAQRTRYLREKDTLQEYQRQRHAAAQTVSYGESQLVVEKALAEIETATKDLQTQRQQLQEAQQQVATHEPLVGPLREEVRLTQQSASVASDAIEKKRGLLVDLKDAFEKTSAAAAELNDAKLSEAAGAIADQCKEVESQVTAIEAQNAERQTRVAQQQRRLTEIEQQLRTLRSQVEQATQVVADKQSALHSAQARLQEARTATEILLEKQRQTWIHRFAVKALKPLSPEQMAMSTVQALDLASRYRREAESEWTNKNKDKKPEEIDEKKKQSEINDLYKKRINQVESTFVSLFAAAPASPQDVFSSTVDQSLFFANDGRVRGWLSGSEGTLVKRLQNKAEPGEFADELCLSVFSRHPDEDERNDIEQYLAARTKDRHKAIEELVWGMITSVEFRFNH